ncbi:MAG: glycosyltransferase [Candidatus Promineifilaceae bacterium]|nr:glycosyltransferase [Candidatus Promineifilaceae bacterium]
MKIGMVTAVYKPIVNGVTQMVSLYRQALEKMGHEVTIFTAGDPDPLGDEPRVIRSRAIPLRDYGYHFAVSYTREVQDLLRSMDVLHCHHLGSGVDLAHRYAQSPIVLTNHTRLDLYTGNYIPLPQQAADVLMRQVWPEYTDMAEVVIAPSESVKKLLVDFGVRRPIEVIPNGVDLQPFQAPPDPQSKQDLGIPESAVLMIYIGRLSEEKNLKTLVERFALTQKIVSNLHLFLVGDGPEADELRELASSMGCADQVHFAGAVSYKQIPNLLAAADFFVTASVTEVHPLTVIEAMAAGLPVAATRSPGIVDSVEHGKTGFLADDPQRGLEVAITALAAGPELRRSMGKAAQIASQKYDISITAAQTVALYERLCRERPDLTRAKLHGRWYRDRKGFRPKLDRLAGLINPDGGYRRLLQKSLNQDLEEDQAHE